MSTSHDIRKVVRDGVSLAYREIGEGHQSPILFVHATGCDGSHFKHQQEFFGKYTRTVSVDLRGHGASDAPMQEYESSVFEDDLLWLCDRLGLMRPIVVGHSVGGNIALKLAVRAPEAVKAVVMIDTFVEGQGFYMKLRELSASFATIGGSRQVFEALSGGLFLPSDNPDLRREILDQCSHTPWHALTSTFNRALLENTSASDLRDVAIPVAYISAHGLPTEIWRVEHINPRVITGKTVGVGHFSTLMAPDQINAMLRTFVDQVNASADAS